MSGKGEGGLVISFTMDVCELPYPEAKRRFLEAFDATYTKRVLGGAFGNVSEAARRAGLDRANFRRLLRKVKSEGAR